MNRNYINIRSNLAYKSVAIHQKHVLALVDHVSYYMVATRQVNEFNEGRESVEYRMDSATRVTIHYIIYEILKLSKVTSYLGMVSHQLTREKFQTDITGTDPAN